MYMATTSEEKTCVTLCCQTYRAKSGNVVLPYLTSLATRVGGHWPLGIRKEKAKAVVIIYLALTLYEILGTYLKKREKWLKFNTFKSTIKDALIKLNELVDESDPDTDLPNIVHAFQTAERIRVDHPDDDWFHLTGLIHDLGKVMAFYGEPQWCVVGDTFPVGCKWAKSIVYGPESFKDNPDTYNPKYNIEYGMYEPHCGLDNLLISWSHDEYMYQFLKHNKSKIPEKGLYMIRYHSLYPWHAGGDYRHLTNEKDEQILQWVLEFNKYDLYTKSTKVPDIEALWPYYEKLIDKYIPGVCEW